MQSISACDRKGPNRLAAAPTLNVEAAPRIVTTSRLMPPATTVAGVAVEATWICAFDAEPPLDPDTTCEVGTASRCPFRAAAGVVGA